MKGDIYLMCILMGYSSQLLCMICNSRGFLDSLRMVYCPIACW